MTALVLDGRALSAKLRGELSSRVDALAAGSSQAGDGPALPRLAILRSGESHAADMYAASLARATQAIGLAAEIITEPTTLLFARIAQLNEDPSVAGIVVTQPVGDQAESHRLVEAIDPAKDVDGATPTNAGRLARGEPAFVPATALAVGAMLEAYEVEVAGRRAVIIGRSAVVGRPVASWLLARDATVVVCHRRTRDLAAETRAADIIVAAAGVPGLLTPDMVGAAAVVVDCGVNAVPGGIAGDVDPAVSEVAAAMTPVPGGIGPVTPMMVARQTVDSAERLAVARQSTDKRRDATPAAR